MNKRIRYGKHPDGYLLSTKLFLHPSNGARYKVILKPLEAQWLVIDDVTDLVSVSGSVKSLHAMKKQAKEALGRLGVSFEEEKRTRT